MRTLEKTAKTVDAAVEMALLELGLDKENVEIEVLEEGSKGFLGLGNKDAKVKVTVKYDPVGDAKDFLNNLFKYANEDVTVAAHLDGNKLNIELSGPDMGVVIGKRGETLDAIQHLTSLAVNKGEGEFVKVSVDSENYREKRNKTLESLSRKLAAKVIRTGRNVTLEPMNSYERRVIHSTLQGEDFVTTYSVGQAPNRKVVIAYKRGEE